MFRSPTAAIAMVQAVCAVGLAAFFVVQTVQSGSTILLVGAVIALVGFGVPAYRNHRRGQQERAEQESGPIGGWGAPRSPSTATRRPGLSDEGDAALVHVIGVLADAGLFAPRTPDPDVLTEAVADLGEPVTAGTVLDAFDDAAHHHPDFRPDDHRAALAGHGVDVEQNAETLRTQIADLDRLAGDALDVRTERVDVTDGQVVIDLVLGTGQHALRYRGRPKALSTVLHVTVARALRATTDNRRLAWLWTDQHVWLATLPARVTVGGLNSDLDAPPAQRWEWVDEQEPVDAGEQARRR